MAHNTTCRVFGRNSASALCALALAGFSFSGAAFAQPAAPAKDSATTSSSQKAPAAGGAMSGGAMGARGGAITAPSDAIFKDRLVKSPRHQEWVDVKAGDRTLKVFVVYPEVKDKVPAVLMIHEIYGESPWAMAEADEIAEAGFIAVLPDLLSGKAPNGGGTSDLDPSAVTGAVTRLPAAEVMADLNAVADYIKTIPSTNGKLVSAGFCWGGGQSFNFAVNRPDLAAACVFYGGPPSAENMKKINAPVYGFYGGNDARISVTVPQTTTDMKAAGKTYEPVIYDGAGHGFMRAGDPLAKGTEANTKARDEGFKKLTEILKKLQ